MLVVQNLYKKFGKQVAVNNLSFTLESGEVAGLLGPNGAGKSTTIKTIAGLLRKGSGKIGINGFINTSIEAKRSFTYVPEVPELYDMLTVKEHLKFIATAYGVENWLPKAQLLMERFELADKQHKLAKELSKGMKQKVSICCALLPEPEFYMFDEPMIGLDPKAIRETKAVLRELGEAGKTILISTHLIDSIQHVCNRILVMKNGNIIADGNMESLRAQLGADDQKTLEDLFLEVTSDENL